MIHDYKQKNIKENKIYVNEQTKSLYFQLKVCLIERKKKKRLKWDKLRRIQKKHQTLAQQ